MGLGVDVEIELSDGDGEGLNERVIGEDMAVVKEDGRKRKGY